MVLSHNKVQNIHIMLQKHLLHWAGFMPRIPDMCIPKYIFYTKLKLANTSVVGTKNISKICWELSWRILVLIWTNGREWHKITPLGGSFFIKEHLHIKIMVLWGSQGKMWKLQISGHCLTISIYWYYKISLSKMHPLCYPTICVHNLPTLCGPIRHMKCVVIASCIIFCPCILSSFHVQISPHGISVLIP